MNNPAIYKNVQITKSLTKNCLGERELPNIKRVKGARHTEGVYFTMDVDVKVSSLDTLHVEFKRDKEIIQKSFFDKKVGGSERYNTNI